MNNKRFVLDYDASARSHHEALTVLDQESGRSFPVANMSDMDMEYNLYLVSVDSHTGFDVAVFAPHEQQAFDEVIDFAEHEGYDGWLMDDEQEAEMVAHGWTISNQFIRGGNHSLYLSEPAVNMHIQKMNEANHD